jgi:hypothetical protein
MEQYYKTLGLRLGATIEEIQEAYDRLLVELDPVNNNNLNIFKIEHDKVIEAYTILINKLNSPDPLDHHKKILERLDIESEINDAPIDIQTNEIEKDNDDKLISDKREEIVSDDINPKIINTYTKKESIMKRINISFKELAFGSILLFIGIGIWGVFLQNLGYFKTAGVAITDDVQNVRVVNTVNSNIEGGQVGVSGNVDVNNTVSVSIDEVLGEDEKKYYFNNK